VRVCVCVCVFVCLCVCVSLPSLVRSPLRKARAGQYIYILSLSLSLSLYLYSTCMCISSLVHSARAEEKRGVFCISYIAGSSKQLQEASELVA
jgi:hypothetical protein